MAPDDASCRASLATDATNACASRRNASFVVPYGNDSYYLNVMAGPQRVWHFRNDPAHEWIIERDAR
ncbi:MAG TPA: 5-deoxy-glucuronate isomerase [Trinickia sp.]|nr:5-deoxy-glucuronate isomerase [Trinickia sp.]